MTVSYPVPAMVLGLDINGLTVVRALGRHGVPVIGVTDHPEHPGCFSKYLREIRPGTLTDAALARTLLDWDWPTAEHRPVLFPTTDRTVEILAGHYQALSQKYRLPFGQPDLALTLLDKRLFHPLGEQAGLNMPKSQYFRAGENPEFWKEYPMPAIVKSCRKIYNQTGQDRLPKAKIVSSREDALKWVQKYVSHGHDCTLQQFIGGGDSDVYFVLGYFDERGEALVTYSGRKLRQWPIGTGGTASAAPAEEPSLMKSTCDFFRAMRWQGLASMEYKRNPSDGQYYAIEPTIGRCDFQEGLAIGNGVNIPMVAYRHAMGLSPDQALLQVRSSKPWICFDADYNAISKTAKLRMDWLRWLLFFLGPVTHSIFNLADPKPFLRYMAARFGREHK